MVVGQQKLRWHEFQHKSNTKMNLERFVVKTRAIAEPPKVFNGGRCESRLVSDWSDFVNLHSLNLKFSDDSDYSVL
jgi:hypothetical protein